MTIVVMVKQKMNTKSAIETAECLTKDQMLIVEKSWNSTTIGFKDETEFIGGSTTSDWDIYSNDSEIHDESSTISAMKVEKKEIKSGSFEQSFLRYFGVKILCICWWFFVELLEIRIRLKYNFLNFTKTELDYINGFCGYKWILSKVKFLQFSRFQLNRFSVFFSNFVSHINKL